MIQNRHRIAVIGAASSVGIRPYDGRPEPRHLDRAPQTLRELGLVERLAADDRGDLPAPPYRNFRRPPGGVRNEREVEQYSRSLAREVASTVGHGHFTLVIGGDCSIVLGTLLGVSGSVGRLGLAYIDAHADFATPEESVTGSAASMCLALAVGRGDSPLARLQGVKPLVRAEDVVLIGRRDVGQSYGHGALAQSGILDMPGTLISEHGAAAAAATALERLTRTELAGFWIHVDADVFDARLMQAVDSPEPDGPDVDALTALVAPLACHPKAIGMQVTIYDPSLDPDRSCGGRIVEFLSRVLASRSQEVVR